MGALLHDKKMSRQLFLVTTFSLLALILGLRGINVGEDTAHYIDVFEKCQNISWQTIFTSGTDVVYETVWEVDRSMEVGYIALNKLIRIFTSNAQWLIFIISGSTCLLMAKFIYENSSAVFFSTYIYICESLYMNSFNLMRQMFALAIGLQAYTALKNHNNRRGCIMAIIYIIIAFLFHKSIIVMLLLIPLWKIKRVHKTLKYVIIGSVLFPFSISILSKIVSIIIPRYSLYFTTNYWESNIGGIVILWIIEIFICLFIYFRKSSRKNKETFIIVSCTAIYLALEIVGLQITAFTRISLYFRSFLILLFPSFTKCLNSKSKNIYKVGIMLLMTLLFISYASTPARIYHFFWQ